MPLGATLASTPAMPPNLALKMARPSSCKANVATLELNAKISEQVLPGTLWIPESLEGAPVGSLINGSAVTKVTVKVAERAMAVAA